MPRQDFQNRGLKETPVASAARTTNADSGSLGGYDGVSIIRAVLAVTAASGTSPTLNVVVEDTLDGTNWNQIGSFAQKTAAAVEAINITTPFGPNIRFRWTLGGTTPSFTFKIDVFTKN